MPYGDHSDLHDHGPGGFYDPPTLSDADEWRAFQQEQRAYQQRQSAAKAQETALVCDVESAMTMLFDPGYRVYPLYGLSDPDQDNLAAEGYRVVHILPATQQAPVLVVFRRGEAA